jgi:Spy/CpxP family protein refolding chaperone
MKTAKISAAVWIVVAIISTQAVVSARAETSPSRLSDVSGTNLVARITEQLNLTPEQKEKAVPIFTESFAKRRAVLEKYQGQTGFRAVRSLRRELEPIRKETDKKLKDVLTPQQMKTLEKLRKEFKDEVRDRVRERRQSPP